MEKGQKDIDGNTAVTCIAAVFAAISKKEKVLEMQTF